LTTGLARRWWILGQRCDCRRRQSHHELEQRSRAIGQAVPEHGGLFAAGLIDQLDSSDGGEFTVAQATAAVDGLTTNWNNEAVQSAKQYLSTEAFSCNDLIAQLDSPTVASSQSLRLRMERSRQEIAS